MNNRMNSGWLGAGGVDLMRTGGTAIITARPRPAHSVVFGDGVRARRLRVRQQA